MHLKVLPAAALTDGEAANQSQASSGGGVNVAAIVVPVVLGVVLLAAIAGVATYLIKSRYCFLASSKTSTPTGVTPHPPPPTPSPPPPIDHHPRSYWLFALV